LEVFVSSGMLDLFYGMRACRHRCHSNRRAGVISQYALEGEIDLGFEWDNGKSQTLGGKARYTDRPTISNAPMMGENFAKKLLGPIPLGAVMLLIQSGYPIDYVLRICVQGINGLDNRSSRIIAQRADPEFYELLGSLRQIQRVGGIRMRSRVIDDRQKVVLIFQEPKTEDHSVNLKKVLRLLGLNPDAREFSIVHGFNADDNRQVAIMSRSMFQIMSDYASYIEVPDSDISEGRVVHWDWNNEGAEAKLPPLIRVNCSASKPDDAYTAVPYRNYWFYIDDRDIQSKRTFSFLLVMFSFTERGTTGQTTPVLTVLTN
jgi:hypothetical protein